MHILKLLFMGSSKFTGYIKTMVKNFNLNQNFCVDNNISFFFPFKLVRLDFKKYLYTLRNCCLLSFSHWINVHDVQINVI